jgi:rsbT co-antagonist protein RsbR
MPSDRPPIVDTHAIERSATLSDESRYFLALVETTSDFIGISTMDGHVLYVNEAGMNLVGWPRDRYREMAIGEFVHPAAIKDFVGQALATTVQRGRWEGETPFLHADGSPIPMSQVLVLLRDAEGRPEVLATIARDLRAQKQMEAALKLALQEMSTPIIQVWDGVLALPVLGLVDSLRAQQMMESLLDAIVRHSCRVAILDLTGVRTIDTTTVNHLFQMISAASLLGASCVVSGISSQVAQIITQLDLDFSRVRTFQSLQGALRYAMQEVGALGRAG